MNTQSLRNGINAGIIFGILTVFLVLTGFTAIAAELIGDLIKLKATAAPLGLRPEMVYLLVFLGLLGL